MQQPPPKRRKLDQQLVLSSFESLPSASTLCLLPYVLRQEIIDFIAFWVYLSPAEATDVAIHGLPVVLLNFLCAQVRDGLGKQSVVFSSRNERTLAGIDTVDELLDPDSGLRFCVPSRKYIQGLFGYFAHDFTRKICLIHHHFTSEIRMACSSSRELIFRSQMWIPLRPILTLCLSFNQEVDADYGLPPPQAVASPRKIRLRGFLGLAGTKLSFYNVLKAFDWTNSLVSVLELIGATNGSLATLTGTISGVRSNLKRCSLFSDDGNQDTRPCELAQFENVSKLQFVRNSGRILPSLRLPTKLEDLMLDLVDLGDSLSAKWVSALLVGLTKLRKLTLVVPKVLECRLSAALEEFLQSASGLQILKTNVPIPFVEWSRKNLSFRSLQLHARWFPVVQGTADVIFSLASVFQRLTNLYLYCHVEETNSLGVVQEVLKRFPNLDSFGSRDLVCSFEAFSALLGSRISFLTGMTIQLPDDIDGLSPFESLISISRKMELEILATNCSCPEVLRRFLVACSRWTRSLQIRTIVALLPFELPNPTDAMKSAGLIAFRLNGDWRFWQEWVG